MAKNITRKGATLTPAQKKKRIDQRYREDPDELSIKDCWNHFIVDRESRGNAKASIEAYQRFYKKLSQITMTPDNPYDDFCNAPISMLADDAVRLAFIKILEGQKLGIQTINHYLRSYRAFGNFCEEEGYIEAGFKCPIKEVEPDVKPVYTEAELKRLLKEPDIENFVEYRTFTIITLILTTGARSNTILNIRIRDVDLDNGYINFNTTKAHKTVMEGLDAKCVSILRKYIERWRSFEETEDSEFLFCNIHEEQLSRTSLAESIANYNHDRGVSKTSIHLFRHTFAKMWITDGGDIITLSKILTHSELEMVKRYSNLYSSDLKKEVEQHSVIAQIAPSRGKSITTRHKR